MLSDKLNQSGPWPSMLFNVANGEEFVSSTSTFLPAPLTMPHLTDDMTQMQMLHNAWGQPGPSSSTVTWYQIYRAFKASTVMASHAISSHCSTNFSARCVHCASLRGLVMVASFNNKQKLQGGVPDSDISELTKTQSLSKQGIKQ